MTGSGRTLTCLECGLAVANTPNVLARHLRTTHSMEWADYVVKHEHGGVWPTCACGCKEALTWRKGGFGKYVRGHDGRPAPKPQVVAQRGWVSNPFTGREEHLSDDDEVALLQHCIDAGDPVTHDHGIRVAWEDGHGRPRTVVPSFKHLQKPLLMTLDVPSDPDYGRRLAALRDWCDANATMLIILRRDAGGFGAIGGHRPRTPDAP